MIVLEASIVIELTGELYSFNDFCASVADISIVDHAAKSDPWTTCIEVSELNGGDC